MRLQAVQQYLEGEEMFLANYSDGLSDLPLPEMIEFTECRRRDAVACFAGVAPTQSFHLVSVGDGGRVKSIRHVKDVGDADQRGLLRLPPGDLRLDEARRGAGAGAVPAPGRRRASCSSYPYDGFWACMDTFKEKQLLEDLYARGQVPWEVWKANATRRDPAPRSGRKSA